MSGIEETTQMVLYTDPVQLTSIATNYNQTSRQGQPTESRERLDGQAKHKDPQPNFQSRMRVTTRRLCPFFLAHITYTLMKSTT